MKRLEEIEKRLSEGQLWSMPKTKTDLADLVKALRVAVEALAKSCMTPELCRVYGPCRFCLALKQIREILGE